MNFMGIFFIIHQISRRENRGFSIKTFSFSSLYYSDTCTTYKHILLCKIEISNVNLIPFFNRIHYFYLNFYRRLSRFLMESRKYVY